MRDRFAREIENPLHIDVDHPVDLLVGRVGHGAGIGDAGIVDEDVERTETLDGLFHQLGSEFRFGNISGHDQRASGIEALRNLLAIGPVAAVEHDIRPFGGKGPGNPFADPARRTCDDGGLAFKTLHMRSPMDDTPVQRSTPAFFPSHPRGGLGPR